MMQETSRFFFAFLAVTSSASVIADSERLNAEQVLQRLQTSAIVSFETVDQPLGRVLLIRGRNKVCALRFVSIRRLNDQREPTMFDSGDATSIAEYEFAEQNSESGENFSDPDSRMLQYKGLRGIGHFSFRVGSDRIKCGVDELLWIYPTRILLQNDEISVAPTGWQRIGDVQLRNPKVTWYHRDPTTRRSRLFLPIETLPQ